MRRFYLTLGVLVLAMSWIGPLLILSRGSMAAHMFTHMGVVAIAAPLIALGLAHRSGLRKMQTLIGLPIMASLVELVVVWGWHAPSARRWAENTLSGTVVEQASFLAAGLFLWLSCLAAANTDKAAHQAASAFGLLLTTIHMTLLGALLALSPRPLYGFADVTCFGTTLTAEQDQQLGAVAMLLVGAVAYLAGGVALLAGLLADPRRRAM